MTRPQPVGRTPFCGGIAALARAFCASPCVVCRRGGWPGLMPRRAGPHTQ